MSLLRYYESQGFDTRGIYDPTVVDPDKQELQQRKFDSYTIEQIIDCVEIAFVGTPKARFQGSASAGQLAGVGLKDLVEKFRKSPEMGFPMQSKFMNFLLRGARKKTFYLRSAAIPWIYDLDKKDWKYTGFSVPSLIISTELDIEEVQTIILAFVSGVEEGHIIDNDYREGEYERVQQASDYIMSAPLYIEFLPNFDMDDVEGMIKRYYREKNVLLVNFDYLQTSIKLMMQMATLSRGVRLREDQMLFMFSDCLKTCATKMKVHIDSGTQLNGEYKDAKEKDQQILRGSKSIADRIDAGYILLPPAKSELEAVKPILANGFYPEPNMIYHLYKCRRGKITRVKVWLHVNLGNCRVQDLFVTTFDNKLIPVNKLTIESAQKIINDHSVEDKEIKATNEELEEAAKSFLSF